MDIFDYDDILVCRSVYAPVKSNMFVIFSDGDAVVFDPHENEELLSLFRDNNVKNVHVLLTHEHYDHTSGLKWLKDHWDYDLYCHEATAVRLQTGRGSLPKLVAFVLAQQDKEDGGHRYKDFKRSFCPYTCKADKTFEKEENLTLGNLHFHVTSTPGHSPGSACYQLNDKLVYTGDTLLEDDETILRFPESSEKIYMEKALPYLRSLKKSMIVMPGHGDPFVLSETNNLQ